MLLANDVGAAGLIEHVFYLLACNDARIVLLSDIAHQPCEIGNITMLSGRMRKSGRLR